MCMCVHVCKHVQMCAQVSLTLTWYTLLSLLAGRDLTFARGVIAGFFNGAFLTGGKRD